MAKKKEAVVRSRKAVQKDIDKLLESSTLSDEQVGRLAALRMELRTLGPKEVAS